MDEVVTMVRLMSISVEPLVDAISERLGFTVRVRGGSADQYILEDCANGVMLDPRIQTRMMCNGVLVYVFEYEEGSHE